LAPGLRFCDECGTPVDLDDAQEMSPAPSPVRGRRVVTILFADLAGSTALEERMDPEWVHAVMQRYYALIRAAVEAGGGRVVKFIGDGAMAVFGVPETGEDDAARALGAALGLHEAFRSLAGEVERDRGVAISLRVGVNTGEVVVGVDDDDVVGDAVNVAARLERAAVPGSVLVGEATWRLTRGEADFEGVRELHVAGKAEIVRARTLVGLHPVDAEVRAEFVGRSHEMDALRAAFHEVVQGRSPRVVTVLGSPGVGKTRLAAELERLVATEAWVLVARCSQQTTAPLVPIAEMLQTLSLDREGLTIEHLARLFADGEGDRDRVVGALTAIVETGAGATPEETLWALRRAVEALAERQPVVLVVDDLQWGETMLLDLVEHLAEWTRGPLLLVLLARPELRERRGALTDGARHRLLGLQGLDPEATVRLACELLGAASLPSGLLRRLPASTGGNPLFVRELLRMLVDDEVLRADAGGRWELRVQPEEIDVPPTIQSLLAARLDRLSLDEQVVLERASIWGTEFPLGALFELLPPDLRPPVGAIMEQLRRKDLVESDGTYWVDEPVYRFHHVLVREAAYRRLLRDRRAAFHEAIAAWIEGKTAALAADYDELMGHHLEQAYLQHRELGPLNEDAVAVGRSASKRLGAAAQRALDRDDPLAAPLAARALDCLPPGDAARAELLLVRCEALLSAADATAARHAVAELEQLAASSARLRAWAACFEAQLATLTDPSHLRQTVQRVAAVAGDLAALDDPRGAAKAHTVRAAALARLGRFAEVEDALDRALTAAHAAGDRRLATVALAAAPVAAVWGPSPVPRAGGRCLDVVRLLRITAGSPVVEATSLRCQAVLEAFRGRTDAARRLISSARDTLEELGQVHGLLEADVFAAIVDLGAGDLDTADDRLRRAYDGLRQLGADADAARAGALLARVELEHGHLDEAERLAGQAGQLAGDDLQAGILWRRVQAEVLARRSRHDQAMVLAEAAVAIAARTDALVQHADACVGLAAVRRAAGDQTGAEQAALQAADLYDRKGASALAAAARDLLSGPSPATRAAPAPGSREPLANAAVAAYARGIELQARQDWNSLSEVLADDVQVEDRRPLTRACLDRAGAEQYMKFRAEQGAAAFDYRVLATRGDRLALLATEVSQHTGGSEFFSTSALDVVEVGRDGRIINTILYSSEDVDGAVADLDDRYLQGEGAPFAVILRLVIDMERAANARDWLAVGEVFAPEVIIHDHHSGGLAERHGREETVDLVRQVSAEQPDARWTLRAIHEPSSDVMVTTIVTSSDAAEVMHHNVLHRGPGGIDRVDSFAADNLDAARTMARSLRTGPHELSNRCTKVWARSTALFANRDWDAMRQLVTEDAVYDDRRPVVRTRSTGDDSEAHARELAAQGVERIATGVLATRGERLALIAASGASLDTSVELFAAESMMVLEITESGLLCANIGYAADDLDSAVAELDRRYIQDEGAPYARLLSENLAGWRALDERDWNTFRGGFAPHVVIHDHQWGLAEATGPRALEDIARRSMDAVPGSHVMVRRILATSDRALAVEVRTSYGAVGTSDSYTVSHLGPSGLDRFEIFGPDALEDALTCYDRLAAPSIDAPLSNRCTQTLRQVEEHFAARDWKAHAATLSNGFVYDDRRSVVKLQAVGRNAAAHLRIAAEGADRLQFSPLAVRGANLALVRIGHLSNVDAEESLGSVMLAVVSSTKEGPLESITVFDLDGLDTATAELDRRYIEDEGAPYATILSLALAGMRAINRRDWKSSRTSFAPDVVMRDHRWGLADATGRERAEEIARQTVDAIPDSQSTVRRIHAVSDRALAVETCLSHGAGTALTVAPNHVVLHLGMSGIDRIETFGPEALDEALACYHRLAAPPIDAPLSNRCTQTYGRVAEHFAARDWDGFAAGLSDGFVYDDHRSVVNTQSVGRRDAVTHMKIAAEQGADRLAFTPLAVRGASLALLQTSTPSADTSFGSVMLALVSSTDDGRLESTTVYDLTDEDRAIAELDRRYIEGEGAPYAAVLIPALAGVRAVSQRDWEAWRASYAPNYTLVEHVYSGWGGASDRDASEALVRQAIDAAPGSHLMVRRIHSVSDRAIATELCLSQGGTGRSADTLFQSVARLGPAGIDRAETFRADALDDAMAAYRRLAARALDVPWNRSTETLQRLCDHFAARDWDAFMAGHSDDYVYDDHRSVVNVEPVGRREAVAHMQIAAEQGADRLVFTPLAVRGANHALVRMGTQSNADAENSFASVMLGVISNTIDGRQERITVYDLDDEDRAIADLDQRYIEGEGAPYAEILMLFAQVSRAFNQRDWDHLQSAFSPAVAKIDHYSAGWNSRRGRADTLADFVEFAKSLSGARVSSPQIQACTTDALLATTIVSGRFEEGGTFELAFHTIYHRTGRVVDHMETFGPDALDDARAAYHRLTTDSAPGNRCTEVFGRWADRFAARDWAGLDALMTDDIFNVDHRPVVRLRQVGRDAARRNVQLLAEQGDRVVYTVLATRGERHALLRLGVQSDHDGDDSFASVMLGVVASSPDDRFAGVTVFGLDDEDRARAELEVQYQDSEMAP
jgi:class 3 adenylate cyclase